MGSFQILYHPGLGTNFYGMVHVAIYIGNGGHAFVFFTGGKKQAD
jgi:hypothetical protein